MELANLVKVSQCAKMNDILTTDIITQRKIYLVSAVKFFVKYLSQVTCTMKPNTNVRYSLTNLVDRRTVMERVIE